MKKISIPHFIPLLTLNTRLWCRQPCLHPWPVKYNPPNPAPHPLEMSQTLHRPPISDHPGLGWSHSNQTLHSLPPHHQNPSLDLKRQAATFRLLNPFFDPHSWTPIGGQPGPSTSKCRYPLHLSRLCTIF
uniref:Uncharacterized protein n=1 Tax=Rousettus aegyptiacus TaxID=9407 RepID=A0A7J8CI07_ROUAE|nr:hypothetical protein HJG63_009043 [Rousettus aegyptiacus]